MTNLKGYNQQTVPECSVFISSTSEDLEAYRVAAGDAVLSCGFRPVAMKYFAASGRPPLTECLEMVSQTAVTVVIVAHRYGWIPGDQPGGDVKSITWLECEHAVSQGKEVIAFLLDKSVKWPAELKEFYRIAEATEKGTDSPELLADVRRSTRKLEEFKQWLEKRTRATFTSPDDLRANMITALVKWRDRHPECGPPPAKLASNPRLYLERLRDETANIDIRGLAAGPSEAHTFPITELYIPLTTLAGAVQTVQTVPTAGEPAGVPKRMRAGLHEAFAHRRLVIIGDPGSGKTTFLRRIAFELTRAVLTGEDVSWLINPKEGLIDWLLRAFRETLGSQEAVGRHPLPILIRVAELSEHIQNCTRRAHFSGPTTDESPAWIAHFLNARNSEMKWGLDQDFFDGALQDGTGILFFDGLDEAPDRIERERIARLFEKATQAYPMCRFVVTTRPQAYEGEAVLQGFNSAHIQPLDPEAIESFLERWSAALYPGNQERTARHKAELSEALRFSLEIRKMAQNPVMLTALAVVHFNEHRLPDQRAELYESVLRWLSRSREKRPGREPAERCLEILQSLALAMQNNAGGRQVRASLGWAAGAIAGEFSKVEERNRFQRSMEFLEQEMGDSGIIVSRGGELQFWHLTFQEHLAARAIAGSEESVQFQLLMDRLYLSEWREVLLLLAGILGVKQGKAKVDWLISAILSNVPPEASLATRARCAGLIGAMVRDLRPIAYEPRDPRYRAVLDSALGIFDRDRAEAVDFRVRLEAAEALGETGDPRLREPNWVRMEAGEFPIGRGLRRKTKLPGFEIGRYPVSVEEYRRFVEDDGYRNERWWKAGEFRGTGSPVGWEEQQQHPNRPVVGLTWHEAAAYCEWAGVRLPTETEWEGAARGLAGRKFPWGDEPPDHTRANYSGAQPTPVGLFPRGATPEGVHDLAGNVAEWTSTWDVPGVWRVLRGGCYANNAASLDAAVRTRFDNFSYAYTGFRCVRD